MYRYQENNITDSMWLNFANSLIKIGQNPVITQMEEVYSIVTKDSSILSKKSFLEELVKYYGRSKENQRCEMITSPQQTFIEFFRKMYAAETKTYILAAFAYQVLNKLDKTKNYDAELMLQTEYFTNRSSKFQEMIKQHAGKLDRDFWVCNRKVNEHTTFQMNKFIYGYLEYEPDLTGSCGTSCSDVKNERGLQQLGPEMHRKCMGMVKDCQSTNTYKFKYCYAKNMESSYLYEYMENDIFKRGAEEMCSKDINPLQNVSIFTLPHASCGKVLMSCRIS
jgi:Domain of unknown function (DUF4803)